MTAEQGSIGEDNSRSRPSYLVDHYSVLGVAPDADTAEITKVFRTQIVQYHPDRLYGLAPEFVERGEFQTRVLTEAYQTLSDPEKRAIFDTELSQWTGPISTDGKPIETRDLSRSLRFVRPHPEAEHFAKEAASISGYNEAVFNIIEAQYFATDNPSLDLEQAYRQQLYLRDWELELEELVYGRLLGIDTRDELLTDPPRNYLETRREHIANARVQIAADFERTFALLGRGELLLLGLGEDTIEHEIPDDSDKTRQVYLEKILQNFDVTAQKLEEIATMRQASIDARLNTVFGEYLYEQTELFNKLIVQYQIEDNSVWFACQIEGTHVSLIDIPMSELAELEDPDKARAKIQEGFNILLVNHGDKIPIEAEREAAVIRHFEAFLSQDQNS